MNFHQFIRRNSNQLETLIILTQLSHRKAKSGKVMLQNIDADWLMAVAPTQNGLSNSETRSSEPDSLIGEFTMANESRISETSYTSG